MKRLKILGTAAAFIALAGCGAGVPEAGEPVKASGPSELIGTEAGIISTYTDAYNDRDIKAMEALMHPEVQWLSVEGSQISVVADGKADLVEQMTDYVASGSATTSKLEGGVSDGPFVAVREVASWTKDDGSIRRQSALAVYEIEDGLVRRVWYYPATQ